MKIVGLTGGIGSGKTTVAKMFSELGVPVYIADVEAKKLTNTSKVIRRKLIELLGENAYNKEGLNRTYVADKIFADTDLLRAVNEIIHPKVAVHFKKWAAEQKSTYVIKEAAILFENGGYKNCDLVVLVTAPKAVRIKRVMGRDKASKYEIEQRMDNQWSDEEKMKLADIIIENIDLEATKKNVAEIHNSILKKS
ncbi:dephospho-CoA kinase [Aequorivita lipolytica]|uniref:Dephospho-CoA kinase n=1 Tax=Aequorivita lipolytica TaxID=153267 RepID=A0A5C6YKW8_9FLAO|nr:dephospho-CoA kinase [Aequorivita lipolytica]TXD68000.1 dephospho-CoA kinase [Aequorivita lipolytica]SRX52192.1 Dephospho-CoA kinase [Aequorivita lipolytica]